MYTHVWIKSRNPIHIRNFPTSTGEVHFDGQVGGRHGPLRRPRGALRGPGGEEDPGKVRGKWWENAMENAMENG